MNGSVKPGSTWRTLRGVDAGELSEARLEAHYAVQWLARVARGYVAPLPDDAHTNLGWVDRTGGFATHALPDGSRLGLQISGLVLAWLDGDAAARFSLDGRSDADAHAWLAGILAARGLPEEALDRPSPYAVPDHPLAHGARYDGARCAAALEELAAWNSNAAASLAPIRERMLERGLAAAPLRCWPHHFDLATLISFPSAKGETAYVGTGLSPGDHYYGEPYFYVSLYPTPDPAALPQLPKLGRWHFHEFTAGVVTAHRILASKSRQADTEDFLAAAVETALAVLR